MSFSQITRGDTLHHALVWISARNRTTGEVETAGFWTGGEDRSFNIGGADRLYHGIGQVLQVPPMVSRVGAFVQAQEIILSANSPEIEAALRGYDPRLAPVEIHVARFDPLTHALLGIDRAMRGIVDGTPRTKPAKGQAGAQWVLKLVSAGMRALTRPLIRYRSDAAQSRMILPDGRPDRFYRHADVAGAVERFWGMNRT